MAEIEASVVVIEDSEAVAATVAVMVVVGTVLATGIAMAAEAAVATAGGMTFNTEAAFVEIAMAKVAAEAAVMAVGVTTGGMNSGRRATTAVVSCLDFGVLTATCRMA